MRAFYRFRSNLSLRFFISFLFALSLPAYVLLRLGYDSYQRKSDLIQRRVLDENLAQGQEIDQLYIRIRDEIRKVGSEFYFDKVLDDLPGATQASVWINKNRKQFDKLEEQPSKLRALRLAYSKHQLRYRKQVSHKILKKGNDFDENDIPLHCQVFVLERSGTDPNYSAYNYNPEKAPEKALVFAALTPPQESIPDRFETKDEVLSFLSQWGSVDYFKNMPNHPAIISNAMGQLVWDELINLFLPVMRQHIFGPKLSQVYLNDVNDILQVNLLDASKSYLRVQLLNRMVDVYYGVLPRNYSSKDYYQGKKDKDGKVLEAIQGLYVVFIDYRQLEILFHDFLSSQVQLAERFHKEVTSLEKLATKLTQNKQTLDFFNFDLNLSKLFDPSDRYNFFLQFDSNQGGFQKVDSNHYSGLFYRTDAQLKDFREVNSMLALLNPATGDLEWNKEELRDFLSDTIEEEQTRVHFDPSIQLMAKASVKLKQALHFVIQGADQEKLLATIYPSEFLSKEAFLITRPMESLLAPVRREFRINVVQIAVVLLLSMILGMILARKVVRPITILSEQVDKLTSEESFVMTQIRDRTEIGKLAYYSNQMTQEVKRRLQVMDTIRKVQESLASGKDKSEILSLLHSTIVSQTSLKRVVLGFFEREFPPLISKYIFQDYSDEEKREFVDSLLNLPQIKEPQAYEYLTFEGVELADKIGFLFLYLPRPEAKGEERVKGVLFIEGELDSDMELLNSIFQQGRTVLMKSFLDQIRQDTAQGQQVQQNLLPNKGLIDPRLDCSFHFVSARGLAGDYYDFFGPIGESKNLLGAVIADVSGKGIGPALFGATSRASMRSMILSHESPGDCLLELNEFLCSDKSSSLFLTMFYALYDLDSQILQYGSAGHNKMYLFRKDGELIELSAKGMPLGVFAGLPYETKQIEIFDGDTLLLYTDGVTELENSKQELFGEQKLIEFYRKFKHENVFDIKDLLIEELDRFREGVFPSDDVTFIFLRYKKPEVV